MAEFDYNKFVFFKKYKKYYGYGYCKKFTFSGHLNDSNEFKLWLEMFTDNNYALNDIGIYYLKIYDSYIHRRLRLKKKLNTFINNNVNGSLVFGTLTISNDYYDCDIESLRIKFNRRVKDYLNCNCLQWIANVDFGDSKGRLHYHFVGFLRDVDVAKKNEKIKDIYAYELDNWKYGFASCKYIVNDDLSSSRISRYCTKLTNHSLKISTNPLLYKLMYSRNKKKV